MMATVVPAYAVQISMTDPFDTPDWIDISNYVRQGSTKRGRQHELQRAVAGTCSLTVSNQDGRFSTFNSVSPFINRLTAADSYFWANSGPPYASAGTWGNGTNCTLQITANQGYDGNSALQMTAGASSPMSASTGTSTSNAYTATPGVTYGFQAQFKAFSVSRSCAVGVGWYNGAMTIIGSVTYGASVSDPVGGPYAKATLTATAPANTVYAVVFVQVTGAPANENHFVTRIQMSQASGGYISPGWAPGGRGLVPARPVRVSATWQSVNYPVYYGYIDSWLPSYGVSRSDQVISCTDGMNLLALSYMKNTYYRLQVAGDGATNYWPLSDPAGSVQAADAFGSVTLGYTSAQTPTTPPTFGAATINPWDPTSCAQFTGTANLQSGSVFGVAAGFTVEAIIQTNTLAANFAGQTYLNMFGASNTFLIGGGNGNLFWFVTGSALTDTGHTVNDNKPHHIAIVATATNTLFYLDGVLVGTGAAMTLTGTYRIETTGISNNAPTAPYFIQNISLTPSALSASQIALHSQILFFGFPVQPSGSRIAKVLTFQGIPASLQNIAQGISNVQAPTAPNLTTPALSYIQTVEKTEQGFFYIDETGLYTYRDRHYILANTAATVSNGTFGPGFAYQYLPGIVPAMDALDLWNSAPASAAQNATVGVLGTIWDYTDLPSIRYHGKRTLTGYTGMLQTSDLESAGLSQYLVSKYKVPYARVRSIKLSSVTSSGQTLPQQLGRKLLDRISIIWKPIDPTPTNTGNFNQDSLIESIQHDFAPDMWNTTWMLSPVDAQSWFILNDTFRGKLNQNVLAF
jgi:hypothetical protein